MKRGRRSALISDGVPPTLHFPSANQLAAARRVGQVVLSARPGWQPACSPSPAFWSMAFTRSGAPLGYGGSPWRCRRVICGCRRPLAALVTRRSGRERHASTRTLMVSTCSESQPNRYICVCIRYICIEMRPIPADAVAKATNMTMCR